MAQLVVSVVTETTDETRPLVDRLSKVRLMKSEPRPLTGRRLTMRNAPLVSSLLRGQSLHSTARMLHKVPSFSHRNVSSGQIDGRCSHTYALPAGPATINSTYLQYYSYRNAKKISHLLPSHTLLKIMHLFFYWNTLHCLTVSSDVLIYSLVEVTTTMSTLLS